MVRTRQRLVRVFKRFKPCDDGSRSVGRFTEHALTETKASTGGRRRLTLAAAAAAVASAPLLGTRAHASVPRVRASRAPGPGCHAALARPGAARASPAAPAAVRRRALVPSRCGRERWRRSTRQSTRMRGISSDWTTMGVSTSYTTAATSATRPNVKTTTRCATTTCGRYTRLRIDASWARPRSTVRVVPSFPRPKIRADSTRAALPGQRRASFQYQEHEHFSWTYADLKRLMVPDASRVFPAAASQTRLPSRSSVAAQRLTHRFCSLAYLHETRLRGARYDDVAKA